MAFNKIVRKEGLIQHADPLTNHVGSGIIQISQQGQDFFLDFVNVKIQNSSNHPLHVYLSRKKKRVKDIYLDPYKGIELTDKIAVFGGPGCYRLKIDAGEDGAFMGGMVKGKSIVSQKIGVNKTGVDGQDPLSWNSVYIAKPNREKPFTTDAVCFVYAILEKPQDLKEYTKAGKRGKKKMKEQLELQKAMVEKGTSEISLRDVKRQCAAAYAKLGLKPSSETLNLELFRKGLKFLGCYLTDSRIIKLFRTADLDGGGEIDCGEFEVAYHINSMLETSHIIKPMDAFDTFDKEHRGEIDEIEFCELMHALEVDQENEELQAIFRKHDADQSGSLDFIEFKDLWLHECDQSMEIKRRGFLPATTKSKLPWIVKKTRVENVKILRHLLEREEAKEYDEFEHAKVQVVKMRTAERLEKSRLSGIRKEKRSKEARIARREIGKIERGRRKEEIARRQEQLRKNKFEKELQKEYEEQKVKRADRVLLEHREKRLRKNTVDNEEREKRGEHLIEFRNQELRKLPESIYKTRQARVVLTYLQVLDIARNKIVSLPTKNCFFNMPSLKKLDCSHNSISSIPDELFDCTELQIIDFYHNSLSMIPDRIEHLIRLQKLNVAENAIMVFPESLCNCVKLESLLCFKNQLETLPDNFGRLTSLHSLDVSVNRLIDFPRSIGGCTSLTSLKFAWNQVEVMQQSIKYCHKLLYLDGANNWLRFLPDNMMKNMSSLNYLNFSFNKLTILPESLGSMIGLQELDLSHNDIVNLPDSFGGMTSLINLRMDHNEIPFIPRSVGMLINLRTFHFRDNNLETLPVEIGGLIALKHLDVSFNAMNGAWPQEIGCLDTLLSADFSHNHLESIPNSIGGMTSLTKLDMSHNNIAEIAPTVGNMLSLETLNLACNKIVELHNRVADAQSLTYLDLSGNAMERAPRELAKLCSLKYLSVYNNRLTSLPAEYGPMIRALDTFECGRNPFSTLKPKWSNKWNGKSVYTTAFQNGYTDGEVQDQVMEAHLWYPDAYEVWHKLKYHETWLKAKLGRFLTTCRAKMGAQWRERFTEPVTEFFFRSKHNLGHALRLDKLTEGELEEEREKQKLAKEYHDESVIRVRAAMKEFTTRAKSSYLYDPYEVKRRFKSYSKNKKEKDAETHRKEIEALREVCRYLKDKQDQRARDKETMEKMQKRREMAMLRTITSKRVIQQNYEEAKVSGQLNMDSTDDPIEDDPYALEIIPRATTS
jgi:Leucine-rich repeat (LRR) protein/Ca2+-binding EF-hand superfamily protein